MSKNGAIELQRVKDSSEAVETKAEMSSFIVVVLYAMLVTFLLGFFLGKWVMTCLITEKAKSGTRMAIRGRLYYVNEDK